MLNETGTSDWIIRSAVASRSVSFQMPDARNRRLKATADTAPAIDFLLVSPPEAGAGGYNFLRWVHGQSLFGLTGACARGRSILRLLDCAQPAV